MRRADLQAGKAIERALEDQVRERDGGVERIADDVGEIAVALKPVLELIRRAVACGWMKTSDAQLLGLGPERVELRIGDLLAGDVAADRRAAQPSFLTPCLELLGGQIRILQRNRGEGDEAVGVRGQASASCSFWIPMTSARQIAIRPCTSAG